MKKVLFAGALLALATALTYCTKTSTSDGFSGGKNETPVTQRACGDICDLHVDADNLQQLNICGVVGNQNACATCTGGLGTGTLSFNGSADFQVRACQPFYISNPSTSNTFISFDGGATFTMIPAGGCVAFATDADCKL